MGVVIGFGTVVALIDAFTSAKEPTPRWWIRVIVVIVVVAALAGLGVLGVAESPP